MKKHHKKIIATLSLWSLIGVIFLAVSIFLVLWAAGYKDNYSAHKWQKAGLIYITCQPRDVEILVSGKLAASQCPASLGLLPGDYDLEIRKTNYQSWKKHITVEVGRVIKFEDIVLFYASPEKTNIASNIKSFQVSPDSNKLLYINKTLNQYNLNTKDLRSIKKIPENLKISSWSADSEVALLAGNGNYYLYNANDNILAAVDFKIPAKIKQIYWLPQGHQTFLILTQDSKFYNIKNGNLKLIADNIQKIFPENNDLYYLTLTKNKLQLRRADFDLTNSKNLVTLTAGEYKLFVKNSNIFILDEKGKLSIVINNSLKTISSQVEDFSCSQELRFFGLIKKSKLLYKTDLGEIWYYDPETKNNVLIYRTSKTISKIEWLDNFPYIIFNLDQKIKVIDLFGKNEITLAPGVNFEIISQNQLIYLDLDKKLNLLKFRN